MNKTLLSAEHLQMSYNGETIAADLSFSLNQGEILGIIGESGCGKTSLLKAILGLDNYGPAITKGRILFENRNLPDLTSGERKCLYGCKIGMIFQNPEAYFNPVRTFKKQFSETMKSHGRYRGEESYIELLGIFEKLNLADGKRILNSCPYEMSGGMNQRIALAFTMILKPKLLLADEPASALDMVTQKLLAEEMLLLREHYGTSILFTTHSLGIAAKLADRTGIMYTGRFVEYGEVKDILKNPAHPYTRSLLSAVPKLNDKPSEKRAEPANRSVCNRLLQSNKPILKARDICKEYKKGRDVIRALNHISFSLHSGEILGIAGESGSGKSTLLKLAAGLEQAESGNIFLENQDITKTRPKMIYQHLQIIFQNPFASFHPGKRIGTSIRDSIKNLRGIRNKELLRQEAAASMEKAGLASGLADKYPRELSGGQCQRAAIARAIAAKPEVLLCDEVTSALDVSTQARIVELLSQLSKDLQMAVLFVSHDLALISNFCDNVMILHQGSCVEYGNTMKIIQTPKDDAAKLLLSSLPDVFV